MKLLLLLFLLISRGLSQEVIGNCEFELFAGIYKCSFSSELYANETDVIQINGTHLEGFDDDGVEKFENVDHNVMRVVPAMLCQKFSNLTVIEISSAGLEVITENSFNKCLKLEVLTFFNNKLKVIGASSFAANVELNYLGLQFNQIGYIEPGSFSTLSNLQFLYIYRNQLTQLDKDTFRGLTSLMYLWLYSNSISELPADVFKDSSQMQQLLLSNNQVTAIQPGFLDFLPTGNMQLHLANNICINTTITYTTRVVNDLKPYFESCFRNYSSDYVSNYQRCRYHIHPVYGYTCELNNVTFLSISEEFEFIGDHLEGRTDDDVHGVAFNLSRLERVPLNVFRKFSNLNFLNIRNTQLAAVDNSTFQACDKLEWLDASDNLIRELSQNAFMNCKKLNTILLDNNNINRVALSSFATKLKLKVLSMKRNSCVDGTLDEKDLRIQANDLRKGKLRDCFILWLMN